MDCSTAVAKRGDRPAPLTTARFVIDRSAMWGIELTDAAGRKIDEVVVSGPIESIRDRCRRLLDVRPDAVSARLLSPDGLLEYEYPEGRPAWAVRERRSV